ncbi:glutathione-dependent formaldehyde-activating enzyme [Xylariaceae sp. FL0016]|nr:glutathione-dependent formaldehyde-activating enzyme [Xylariaceae sp. FL0016]
MAQPSLKSYRGNCHCGAFVFVATIPDITGKVTSCNCSICYKKAAMWAVAPAPASQSVTWEKGDVEALDGYTFGPGKFEHKFCGSCGTPVCFVGYLGEPPKDGETKEKDIGINVRCLQHGQIPNPWDMELNEFDGAGFGTTYELPKYTGPEPKMEIEGGKLYTGSCHCGAVKVALKSKPLNRSFTDQIYECNCSGCIRAGGTCVYPHKDAVVIVGEENTAGYSFGPLRAWEKIFCKNCGVFIGRRPLPIPEEVAAKLPPQAKMWTVDMNHLRPLNLRILDKVDLKELKDRVTKVEGYENIPPMYVNP